MAGYRSNAFQDPVHWPPGVDYLSPPPHIPYNSRSVEDLTRPQYRQYAVQPSSSFTSPHHGQQHRSFTLPLRPSARIVLPVGSTHLQQRSHSLGRLTQSPRSKSTPTTPETRKRKKKDSHLHPLWSQHNTSSGNLWSQNATSTGNLLSSSSISNVELFNPRGQQQKQTHKSSQLKCNSKYHNHVLDDEFCSCTLYHARPFVPVRHRGKFDSLVVHTDDSSSSPLHTDLPDSSTTADPSALPSVVTSTTKFSSPGGDTPQNLFAERSAIR